MKTKFDIRGFFRGFFTDRLTTAGAVRWISALSVVFLVLVCLQSIDDTYSYLRDSDNAFYMHLANSLADGHGFTRPDLPGAPPHTQYPPPLFPLLLSPFLFVFGYNFMWMRFLTIATLAGAFFLSTRLVEGLTRRDGSHEAALVGAAVAALFITNHGVLIFTREILPEIPYIMLSLLALVAIETYSQTKKLFPFAVVLPIVVALAYMMKNHGLMIYAAVLCSLALRAYRARDYRAIELRQFALFAVVTIAPLIVWVVRGIIVAGEPMTPGSSFIAVVLTGFYKAGPQAMAVRIADNLVMLTAAAGGTLLAFVGTKGAAGPWSWPFVLQAVATLLAGVGLAWRLAKRSSAADFYLLFYLALIVLWPVYGLGDMRRYMIVVVPLLYFYAFVGLRVVLSIKAWSTFRPAQGPGYIFVLFAFLLALNVAENRAAFSPSATAARLGHSAGVVKRDLFKRVPELRPQTVLNAVFNETSPCYANYLAAAFLLRDISSAGEVVLTRKPELAALITGTVALKFPFTDDRAKLMDFIRRKDVKYVLVDGCFEETVRFLIPTLTEYSGEFESWRIDNKQTGIYRYKGGYTGGTGG